MLAPIFFASLARRLVLSAVLMMGWGAVLPAPTFASTELRQALLLSLRDEARAYEHGEGVPKDPLRAIELYCEGARAGDDEARYSLGWIYANGRGVARDDAVAAYFFQLAADQGHEPSSRMLRFVGPAASPPPTCLTEKPPLAQASPAEWAPIDIEGDFANAEKRWMALMIKRIAPDYGIDPRLALAIATLESNLNPYAVSPKKAQGLMQLIPATSARFNVKKPFDAEQNLRGGLTYLRWLLAYFRGDVILAAAAYNAGEGAVNRHLGIPPFAETRGYVRRILEIYRRIDHPYDAELTEPSPELPRIQQRKNRASS